MTQDAKGRMHGKIDYVQLPARDLARSAAFYEKVFGWSVDVTSGSFEAPGVIGQFTTEPAPAAAGGPVLWISADSLYHALEGVVSNGGTVHGRPNSTAVSWLRRGSTPTRPANRIGVVVQAGAASLRPQTPYATWKHPAAGIAALGLAVTMAARSTGCLATGLLLQLPSSRCRTSPRPLREPRCRGRCRRPAVAKEVADFDDRRTRRSLNAPIARTHRNPPEGEGNGPGHREIGSRT